jgi:hypothetical protein
MVKFNRKGLKFAPHCTPQHLQTTHSFLSALIVGWHMSTYQNSVSIVQVVVT